MYDENILHGICVHLAEIDGKDPHAIANTGRPTWEAYVYEAQRHYAEVLDLVNKAISIPGGAIQQAMRKAAE